MKLSSKLKMLVAVAAVFALGAVVWKMEVAARHRMRVSLGLESATVVAEEKADGAPPASRQWGSTSTSEDNQ